MVRTERFEIRLEDGTLARIDEWMEQTQQATSRSDAVRQLVELGLSTVTGKSIHLSDGEKLNFMLLRDIVKHLKVDTDTNVDFVAESIYGGHYWAPTWDMNGLFHKHADQPDEVKLVIDTLDMYNFIEDRIKELPDADVEKIKAAHYGFLPKFNGFDGNNEGTLMSIARFVVRDMKRFEDFKDRDFNSHSPKAEQYRRMTEAFEPIRASLGFGRSLSADQIIAIATA